MIKGSVGQTGAARIGLLLVVLFGVAATVVGLAWTWFVQSPPSEVRSAEDALADGDLAAIAYVNVDKLRLLRRHWFGEADPKSLPLETPETDLLTRLLSAERHASLDHLLLGLNASEGQEGAARTGILLGRFEPGAIESLLEPAYRMESLGRDQWRIEKKAERVDDRPLCAKDGSPAAASQTHYLFAGPGYLVIGSARERTAAIWRRLQEGNAAAQSLDTWRTYRNGQLAGFLVTRPQRLGRAFGAVQGMALQGAAGPSPQLDSIGLRVGADPALMGLGVSLNLGVTDQAWVDQTAESWRDALAQARHDSRSYTPSLARFLSRVGIDSNTQSLDLGFKLDGEAIDELHKVAEEGVSWLFAGFGDDDAQTVEQVQPSPTDYARVSELARFAPLQLDDNRVAPLFHKGAFAVDLKSIKKNDDGLLELWLESEAGMPGLQGHQDLQLLDLAFRIDSVTDRDGNELLRDERCLDGARIVGLNHEPADTAMPGDKRITSWKHVRLKPGTSINDVRQVTGSVSIAAPTQIGRHVLDLRAGEVVESGGLRFFLNRVGRHSVTYQLSGNMAAMLELRALNDAGQVLQKGWQMSGADGSRVTQHFSGEVAGLELYVADRVSRQKADFVLRDLFSVSEAPDARPIFAPTAVDPVQWQAYRNLDMQQLTVEPKDWHLWGKAVHLVGKQTGDGIRAYFTHLPKAWGNNPTAHLYFPMLPELPGVLSALSYRIDEPAPEGLAAERFVRVSYPYRANTGETVIDHRLEERPIALSNLPLRTGLQDNERLQRLKGEFIFRLPTATRRSTLAFTDLWNGKVIDGIKVRLTEVGRGMFPGYALKLEGALDKLVNLHGVTRSGKKVMPQPVNFQDGGYWTMTLPFADLDALELTTAREQQIHTYPFDVAATYDTLVDRKSGIRRQANTEHGSSRSSISSRN